jgi:hypothetical protein
MTTYAGYSPTEARNIAATIDRAARNAKRDDYAEYAAESRACGYSPESFAEWLGEEATGKAAASERLAHISFSELDLH